MDTPISGTDRSAVVSQSMTDWQPMGVPQHALHRFALNPLTALVATQGLQAARGKHCFARARARLGDREQRHTKSTQKLAKIG
jgi:hypothetical protein